MKFDLDSAILIKSFTEVCFFKGHTKRFDFSFLEDSPGTYALRNTATNKIYIGATKNVKKRVSSHFGRLRRGIHKIKELQKDYSILTNNSFEIVVFIYCEEDDLEFFEEAFFTNFKNNCYNKRINTQNNIGLPLSEETKRLMGAAVSKANKGKIPKNLELIRKLQKRPIAEFTDGVQTKDYNSCKEAGEKLGVCYKRINKILVKNSRNETVNPLKEYPNKTWRYLDDKPVRIINRNKDEPK